jgi:hypothetical protein
MTIVGFREQFSTPPPHQIFPLNLGRKNFIVSEHSAQPRAGANGDWPFSFGFFVSLLTGFSPVAQLDSLDGKTRMKKSHVFIIVLAAFSIGGVFGFYVDHHRYVRTVSDMVVSDEFGRSADAFTTLRDLRSGDTNAVFDSLESEVDIGAVSLFAVLEEYPSIEHATNYQNFLRRIAAYRAEYPHHTDDTNMDSMVATALLKATKETGH